MWKNICISLEFVYYVVDVVFIVTLIID